MAGPWARHRVKPGKVVFPTRADWAAFFIQVSLVTSVIKVIGFPKTKHCKVCKEQNHINVMRNGLKVRALCYFGIPSHAAGSGVVLVWTGRKEGGKGRTEGKKEGRRERQSQVPKLPSSQLGWEKRGLKLIACSSEINQSTARALHVFVWTFCFGLVFGYWLWSDDRILTIDWLRCKNYFIKNMALCSKILARYSYVMLTN